MPEKGSPQTPATNRSELSDPPPIAFRPPVAAFEEIGTRCSAFPSVARARAGHRRRDASTKAQKPKYWSATGPLRRAKEPLKPPDVSVNLQSERPATQS